MPSYTQYMRQMAVLDAKDDDIESWITVRGNHIPIKKGQSKEDAVKSFIAGKKKNLVENHNSLVEAMNLEEKGYFKKDPKKRDSITQSAIEMGKEEKNLEELVEFGVKEANAAKAESKYDPEFETVRKNALANSSLYGGRYTQKSKAEAYKEYKKDTEKKAEPKESGKSEPKQYTFHYDAGHGWLEVPKEDVEELGIEVSSASYSDGKNVYLEEDLDAQTFAKAYEKKYGVKHKEINHNDGDYSRIRNMGGYKPEPKKQPKDIMDWKFEDVIKLPSSDPRVHKYIAKNTGVKQEIVAQVAEALPNTEDLYFRLYNMSDVEKDALLGNHLLGKYPKTFGTDY